MLKKHRTAICTSSVLIQSRQPPGPKGTIIGGNIRQFRAGLLDFLLETAREYGPLASFRIGPKLVFLATGPDLIEQVLGTDAKNYIEHFGARAFKPVLGNGLVTSEGAFWLGQGKLIQPTFSKDRVQSYAATMIGLTNEIKRHCLISKLPATHARAILVLGKNKPGK